MGLGAVCRELVAIAGNRWVTVTSDRETGYWHWDIDHFEDPVELKQSFEELYQLSYRPCLITTLDHPDQARDVRKAGKPWSARLPHSSLADGGGPGVGHRI